jgi:predicted RNase H-like nuclease (RuvC/YqgF family)
MSRRYATLQSQHSALQAELQASRDVLNAREREVDIMRMRVETAEREVENLRDELAQAQHRITTLLEMGGGHGFGLDDNEDMRSEDGSEEASMAFDKVCLESEFRIHDLQIPDKHI